MSGQVCKEELCGAKAGALIDSAHEITQAGEMPAAALQAWNGCLEEFIGHAEAILFGPGGPVEAAGRGGRVADSEATDADVREAALHLQEVAARAVNHAAHQAAGLIARLIDTGDEQGLEVLRETAVKLRQSRPLLSTGRPAGGGIAGPVTE